MVAAANKDTNKDYKQLRQSASLVLHLYMVM